MRDVQRVAAKGGASCFLCYNMDCTCRLDGGPGNTHRILMENHINPRGRVLLDKIVAPYPVKKLPSFYKNLR